jgi:hypothetical protein
MRTLFTVLLLSAPSFLACNDESRPDAAVDAGPLGLPNVDASPGKQDAGTTQSMAHTAAPLPSSLKGYELYAWEEDGSLRFMLITGTNRQKTLEELRVENSTIERGDGWVAVSSSGLANLEALLARVPGGTPVLLLPHDGLPALAAAQRASIEALLAKRLP